jgi:hypothetical protein
MEPNEIVWEGKIGHTPLRVGVPHAGRIVAEWDSPQGTRFKVSDSMEEFERSVLFQLLLSAGETEETATQEVVSAIATAQAARPAPAPDPSVKKRRKNPKARHHRRSRRPPRRR